MAHSKNLLSGRNTRILIVDDHPLMREGLASRITPQDDMEVCGEADSVSTALAEVEATDPDLIIVDIQLVDSQGIDLVKEVHRRRPKIKMLMVSAFDESLYAERALRAGAHGYINKRDLQDNLIEAIRMVVDGQRYLSPKMTQVFLGQAMGDKDKGETDPVSRLSDRELEVFRLIGQGNTTGAIAKKLFVSVHTIDSHREKIRHKLDVKNSAELMQRAVQWVLENG